MKIKYGNRHNWRRVQEKEYLLTKLDENILVATVLIKRVTSPLIVYYDHQSYNVADISYKWVQYFIKDAPYVITTVVNPFNEIIQWYIDICHPFSIDLEGNPYFIDLYLDVVVFPDDSYYLLDEDELEEAFCTNQITLEEYNLSKQAAASILTSFSKGDFSLLDITKK